MRVLEVRRESIFSNEMSDILQESICSFLKNLFLVSVVNNEKRVSLSISFLEMLRNYSDRLVSTPSQTKRRSLSEQLILAKLSSFSLQFLWM